MANYYDRPHKIPVWVVLDLKDKNMEVSDNLMADGAFILQWPSQTFANTVKLMGNRGWKHITEQPFPYFVDIQFIALALSTHIKSVFGENTKLTGGETRSYSQAINRQVKSDDDFRRIFEEALGLETDISLSQVFDTATPKEGSKVYVSFAPVDLSIARRLTENLIVVGSGLDATVNVKGKKSNEVKEIVDSTILNALKSV